MTLPQSSFKLLYSIFFTYLDPLVCIWGASMDCFDPALVLSSHIPEPTPDTGHAMILRQRAGGMLNIGFVSAVLLRYSSDPNIWRIVQSANLIVDATYFWAVYGALATQDRLNPSTWRKEDYGSIAITGIATLVRLAFLTGVGVSKQSRNARKSS